jgi:thioredoxin-related protein
MNSSIQVYNSYLKGTKTIFGSFPIYFSSYELICNKNKQILKEKQDIDELLSEFEVYYLISEESNDKNFEFFLINIDEDNFDYQLTL